MKRNLETRVARCIRRHVGWRSVVSFEYEAATRATCERAARAVIRMVKRELARRPK